MQHWWHYLIFVGLVMLPYAGEWLLRRAKRGSERWQHRSERQQRLLARLPGIVVALTVFVLLDAFNVPW